MADNLFLKFFLVKNFSHDRCEKFFYPFTYHNYIGIELFYFVVVTLISLISYSKRRPIFANRSIASCSIIFFLRAGTLSQHLTQYRPAGVL